MEVDDARNSWRGRVVRAGDWSGPPASCKQFARK
jgi:hypothetical protein